MSVSFIAFHIGAYQQDTQQLTVEGHGAYFLLLQHCWTHGRIPLDDAARAAICKVTVARYRKQLAPMVSGYFDDAGENKRASAEIAKAERLRTRQAMAGHRGGLKSALTRQATAKPRLSHGSSHGEAMVKQLKNRKITTSEYDAAREGTHVDNVDNLASNALAASGGLAELIAKKGWNQC